MTMLIALVLTVGLLASCSGAPMMEVETAPPPGMPAAMAETVPLEAVSYRVTEELWEDAAYAEDGTELVRYSFELPVLSAVREDGTTIVEPESPGEELALKTVETFNEQFESWRTAEDFQELTAWAAEELALRAADGTSWLEPYFLELTCSVYQTAHLISVSAQYSSYTGGAHPNTCLLGWNFDLAAGAFFLPETLAEDGQQFLEAVQGEIVRQAGVVAEENDMEPEDFFWTDYRNIAAAWSSYAVSFDETGMTVGFSPYEMACYAAGSQVFTLPYDVLAPYLSQRGREALELETVN